MNLPEQYKEKMKALLGEEEFSDYLACMEQKNRPGLRVNRLKITRDELREMMKQSFWQVAWIPDGLCYEEECQPAKHPYYYAGLYYLQEPSAMTPAFVLSVKPGDKVLDLCAAPGGKSTALAGALQGEGVLYSNDISPSRCHALLKNLELCGARNICVSSESPLKLSECFEGYFDKILVDAPCSGEGMFRKDPDMVASWEKRGPESYIPIQREILTQAVCMLKPGGELLYSTCTFDEGEDEGNVRWLLQEFPEMQIDPIEPFEGAQQGIGLSGCLRLYPHKIAGEGHFLAKLKKREQKKEEKSDLGKRRKEKKMELKPFFHAGLFEFFEDISWQLDKNHLFEKQGAVYLLPDGLEIQKGIRYLRTGLYLGEVKKDRFEPSQALAMALKPGEYANTCSFVCDDERVVRYLKGETVALRADEADRLKKGWCLVAVDGFPLGFAKVSSQTLKNKYYPGWRWQ